MGSPGYIEVTIRFAKEGGRWTAECVELGTAAYGDSFEEADAAIKDMIELHLNALEDVAAAENFFRKHGVRFHRTTPRKPVQVPMRDGDLVERRAIPVPAFHATES